MQGAFSRHVANVNLVGISYLGGIARMTGHHDSYQDTAISTVRAEM